ncbi:hypothetical protein ACUOFC_46285, partial [Escherichia sp. TWPC-MK]
FKGAPETFDVVKLAENLRQRGTSVVAISHDAAFTRRHFSRVVRLEDGLIRNVNPPDDIHP